VAFHSFATNLVSGDTNNSDDIFVRDLVEGTTTRASVADDGTQATGGGAFPDISGNGRFVVFESFSTNLPGGGGGAVYRRDLVNGTTMLVSIDLAGGRSRGAKPAISHDGNVVAFVTFDSDVVTGDTNNAQDVFARDLGAGTTTRVSVDSGGEQGNANSGNTREPSAISGDGRFVAFGSAATNLVGTDTNASTDIFLRDLRDGVTTRVSVSSTGTESNGASDAPSLDGDGSRVAFESSASNLVPDDAAGVDVFVRDTLAGTTTVESVDSTGVNRGGSNPEITADGDQVVFSSGSPNIVPGFAGQNNIFIHELAAQAGPIDTSTSTSSSTSTSTTSSSTTSTTSSTVVPTTSSTSTTVVDGPCDGREPTITGAGMIMGTRGDDVVLGSDDDDFIIGGGGNDIICGGGGNDTIDGRAGDDRIFGQGGNDRLIGAAGNDFLDGGEGDDDISGDAGDDALIGGSGNDKLRGGNGHDASNGDEGDDDITDGEGDDDLSAGDGNDTVRGGEGEDHLSGGDGDDRLLGEGGNDTLESGTGTNRLNGGDGTDICSGSGTNSLNNC
jgi:Ca2+-binding RTX toxin-like protein